MNRRSFVKWVGSLFAVASAPAFTGLPVTQEQAKQIRVKRVSGYRWEVVCANCGKVTAYSKERPSPTDPISMFPDIAIYPTGERVKGADRAACIHCGASVVNFKFKDTNIDRELEG